jgi:hypothetical protein
MNGSSAAGIGSETVKILSILIKFLAIEFSLYKLARL